MLALKLIVNFNKQNELLIGQRFFFKFVKREKVGDQFTQTVFLQEHATSIIWKRTIDDVWLKITVQEKISN